MRTVKRPTKPPDVLNLRDENSLWYKERKVALAFFKKKANRKKAFTKFKVYKHESVKAALETMFYGKCAYCEFRYIAGHPVDIEHYRPKGEVLVEDKKEKSGYRKNRPGYYWLAGDWHNLLPSCIDCNRERTQLLADGTKEKRGKAIKFPIANETYRADAPDFETKERRLLLNPCRDKPEAHLEFLLEFNKPEAEDKTGLVCPRLTKKGEESPRGRASIDVYGLQRLALVQQRKRYGQSIKTQMMRVQEAVEDFNSDPTNLRFEARMRREIRELEKFMNPDEEFTAMAKQFITPFLQGLKNG